MKKVPPNKFEKLFEWQSTCNFTELVNSLMDIVPNDKFFKLPKYTVLQEAWIASRFISHVPADQVRMCDEETENFPDFRLQSNGNVSYYECVEAYELGRRRAEEYSGYSEEVKQDPSEFWEPRTIAAIDAMHHVINKKLKKSYSTKVNLIVYLSTGGSYEVYDDNIRQEIQSACKNAKEKFQNIYIMWSGNLVKA